jgi:hypothetical protein
MGYALTLAESGEEHLSIGLRFPFLRRAAAFRQPTYRRTPLTVWSILARRGERKGRHPRAIAGASRLDSGVG